MLSIFTCFNRLVLKLCPDCLHSAATRYSSYRTFSSPSIVLVRPILSFKSVHLHKPLQQRQRVHPKSCRMIKATSNELQLHFSVLTCGKNVFSQLSNYYSEHLLSSLQNWYGRFLHHDPSLAHEAVYNAIREYCEHPRAYVPQQGSLLRFLELNADRAMQQIFERENFQVRLSSVDRLLAKYLDNERDFQLAKLMLNRNSRFFSFVTLLDIGGFRIGEQLSEVKRHKTRISKLLRQALSSIYPSLSSTPEDNFLLLPTPIPSRTHNRGRVKRQLRYQHS